MYTCTIIYTFLYMHIYIYTACCINIYIFMLLTCVYHNKAAILLDVSVCLLCESLKKGWLLSFLLATLCRLTRDILKQFDFGICGFSTEVPTLLWRSEFSRIPFHTVKCFHTCLKTNRNSLQYVAITSSIMKEARPGLVTVLSLS